MKYLIALLLLATNICCESMQKNTTQVNTVTPSKNDPKLTAPKVRKVWIADKIESDKYIEGHWIWILESTTTWSQ